MDEAKGKVDDIDNQDYILGVPNPATNPVKFLQRFAAVEERLRQYEADSKVPPHMTDKVKGVVEADRERRSKLRMKYLEEAEEYRDNGDQPERVVFLALANAVENGIGSVRFHHKLLADFEVEQARYREDYDHDSDLDD